MFNLFKLNYNKLDEDKCQKMAKKELPGEDEIIAQNVLELIDIVDDTPNGEESLEYQRCREIGDFLCANGGHWRMILIARRVRELSRYRVLTPKYCEIYWNGICGWMMED